METTRTVIYTYIQPCMTFLKLVDSEDSDETTYSYHSHKSSGVFVIDTVHQVGYNGYIK